MTYFFGCKNTNNLIINLKGKKK